METIKEWLEVVSLAASLAGGLVAGLWGYSKYILERGLLPPARFWITCQSLGVQGERHLLQILIHLKNIGTSTLVASDIGLDLLYLESDTEINLLTDHRRIGRLRFTKSLRKELTDSAPTTALANGEEPSKSKRSSGRAFPVVPHDTFVQAGVHQTYTFVTAVPLQVSFLLIRSSFRYAQAPTLFARVILFLSRRLGLVHFTLAHITEPHTAERAFALTAKSQVESAPNPPLQRT